MLNVGLSLPFPYNNVTLLMSLVITLHVGLLRINDRIRQIQANPHRPICSVEDQALGQGGQDPPHVRLIQATMKLVSRDINPQEQSEAMPAWMMRLHQNPLVISSIPHHGTYNSMLTDGSVF